MLSTQILTDLPETDLKAKDTSTEIVGFLILEGKKHEIKRGDTKIGRDPSVCSIVVDNCTVSKIHSVIESEGKDDTFVYDVGSTNLTRLGKKILKPHYRYKLENGSIITLGNVIGTVDLATELDENPSNSSPTKSAAFKIGLVTNYNPSINENIFDLETQVSQIPKGTEKQPCPSTDLFKSTALEKLQYSKNPNISFLSKWNDKFKKSHGSYIKNVNQINLETPSQQVIYSSLEDSNIFNMMTQEQIYSPKVNSQNNTNSDVRTTKEDQKTDTAKSLLDDGQDDIFCNFENLKFLSKENTSTPLKTECAPSTSKNATFLCKPKFRVPKSLQNDFEIDKEIDSIKNDVEINRSFDEEFFSDSMHSPKVFKESVNQTNECHSSIKLTHSLNISKSGNINNSFTKSKEKENFAGIKESVCNIDETNMSQLTVNNFESFKVDSPSKTISPSYLEITISDEHEPKTNNDDKHNLCKNLFSTSKYLNESNKNNSEHELVKKSNSTFHNQPDKFNVSCKETGVDDDFSKIIKKELQMIPDTSDDETESFLRIVENVERKKLETSVSSQLHLTLNKATTQNSASFNFGKKVTKLTEENNKNCDNQYIKIKPEEEFSSDSDEFIASQIIKSQRPLCNKSVNNLEDTQVERLVLNSPAINDFSLDFIETPDLISRTDTTKKIFKEHLKGKAGNSSPNDEDPKHITPLTQTINLNAFVPESSEDDNTPDLEIIEETLCANKNRQINIKIENTEIKEELNSIALNQSGQFEVNQNENSDTSYIFEIDDISESDKPKGNKTNFGIQKRLSNNFEDHKKEILTENVEFPEHMTQSSGFETPDLIINPENILSEKQIDNDVINEKFNLYEDDNSDEINSPNTQVLEETLIKIIEDNKENKKQSSCSARVTQSEIEKINNFSTDLSFAHKDIRNFQSDLLKESPGKRSSDNEISPKAAKKIKSDSDLINDSDKVSKSKEEEILNFWQVPDIAQAIPKKSTNPKCLLNQEKVINSADKLHNLLSEEFNSNNGFALGRISHTNQIEKVKEADSSGSSTLLKKATVKKSGPARNIKKNSLLEVPLEISFTTRILRSVSKHYGTSIASRSEMVTSCARNLLKDSPTRTVIKDTSHTRTSLKKSRRSKIFNDESYFSCSSVNVVFTGFDSPCLEKIIQELGGRRIDDLKSGHVVVTDRVRRTIKFLCAVGLSFPIVSPDWLLSSKKENKFLNPWQYILKDEESEERWDFDLRNALEKAKRKKFLQNFQVFATESVKPPPKDMLLIAECCGATPLVHRSENWPKKTLFLTCEEDKDSWPPPKFRSVKILHFEFLLSGVLQQQTDFRTFQLR